MQYISNQHMLISLPSLLLNTVLRRKLQQRPLAVKSSTAPFFIIGSGRSGNTLLRRIIGAHPDVYIPPETYVLGRLVSLFEQNQHLSWKQIVYLCLAQFEFHHEFDTFGISLRPLALELSKVPQASQSLAYIIDEFYKFAASEHNVLFNRWGDKTPLNTFYLNEILSVFPTAQFIHIIRDGCDVIPSYVKAGIYDELEDAAKRWVQSVRLADDFSKQHKGRCFEVRYEELVTHPEEVTKKVCKFLGITFEEAMLNSQGHASQMGDVTARSHHKNVFKPISPESIGKGRRTMSKTAKSRLAVLIGKELEIRGYSAL